MRPSIELTIMAFWFLSCAAVPAEDAFARDMIRRIAKALPGVAVTVDSAMTPDDAWALAIRQTSARLPALPTVAQLRDALVVYKDQTYLSGLLIDLPGWSRLSKASGPDLLMTVAADTLVLVGTKPDGPDFNAFKTVIAKDCTDQRRCISPNVYRLRHGGWQVA